LRERLGMKESDDGVFFITFNDYMNYYKSTTICRVHDGYHYKSITVETAQPPFNNQKSFQLVNISLKEKSKIFFTVHQVSSRFVRKGYETSFVKVIIARDLNYETLMPLEFLESKCLTFDTVTVESRDELVVGEYVALVEIDWR
jgi:hypothetical protein